MATSSSAVVVESHSVSTIFDLAVSVTSTVVAASGHAGVTLKCVKHGTGNFELTPDQHDEAGVVAAVAFDRC